MFKRCKIYQSVMLALVLPGMAVAEIEITGYLKNETSVFTRDGQVTGEAQTVVDEDGHERGDLLKFENSARVFMNGDIGENATWHADINLIYDSEGVNDNYKGHKLYTQHDYLRELYVDTTTFDWDLRLGKQQVVWGTADGIKLLDIINPTDYRELNQNAMEDSRIPIWMINAERNIGDSSNIQFIISQAEENKIPGLNEDGDAGHPFKMKGVDTITGQVNGFLNIAPNLGATAGVFQSFASQSPILGATSFGTPASFVSGAAFGGMYSIDFDGVDSFGNTIGNGDGQVSVLEAYTGYGTIAAVMSLDDLNGDNIPDIMQPTTLTGAGGGSFTVQNFIDGMTPFCFGGSTANADAIAQLGFSAPAGSLGSTCSEMLNNIAQGFAGNYNATRLVSSVFGVDPDEAFEYMNNASFATFDTFAGISTDYVVKDRDEDVNFGTRFRHTTDGGINFSLNYFYGYDPNPAVDIHWESNDRSRILTPEKVDTASSGDLNGNGTVAANPTDFSDGEFGAGSKIALMNADGTVYDSATEGSAALVFEESYNRIHNLGASFDSSLDFSEVPLILRGEFLYQQDVKSPIIDRNKLGDGDLVGALKMVEGDYFKYVLGLDATVATNLFISGQFIQFVNLDYVDENVDENGASCATPNCGVYTGDLATMSLTNGLNKGYEFKEFYSLFFSKPFGESQEHRWNNIFIFEEGGGKWNRFDVEYSFTDTLLGSAEWNHYWGDENTTFGQFHDSSNLQVGIKWLIE